MIKKLRRKLVLVLMCVELAFVISILTGLYLNTRSGFVRMSLATMHQAARRADAPREISSRPPREEAAEPGVPLAIITQDTQCEPSIAENQIYSLSSEELLALYERILALKEESGILSGLRYLRVFSPDGGVRVVLASTELERELLSHQALLSVAILFISSAVFYGVSLLLSRLIVRPVAETFQRERQFAADASHELKTPLTVVLSNTEMLLSSGVIRDEKNLRRLDNIRAESKRMRALVEDLLSLARSDAGRQISKHTPQCLSYIAACALSGFEPVFFDAGRTLEEDIVPRIYVNGDAVRLRELIDILLDNACKYSNPGSQIGVELSAVHKEAVLLVRSTGNPIAPRERKAVFRRFYRLDQSRGQQPGYGLGLSIAHSIVREHKGRIGVHGGAAEENVFYVHLPLIPAPESSPSSAHNERASG